jgi:hypothetical protein
MADRSTLYRRKTGKLKWTGVPRSKRPAKSRGGRPEKSRQRQRDDELLHYAAALIAERCRLEPAIKREGRGGSYNQFCDVGVDYKEVRRDLDRRLRRREEKEILSSLRKSGYSAPCIAVACCHALQLGMRHRRPGKVEVLKRLKAAYPHLDDTVAKNYAKNADAEWIKVSIATDTPRSFGSFSRECVSKIFPISRQTASYWRLGKNRRAYSFALNSVRSILWRGRNGH